MCGGTFSALLPLPPAPGLSPRVRGNPAAVAQFAVGVWSIPACAGEPLRLRFVPSGLRVYPRVCGGTSLMSSPAVR